MRAILTIVARRQNIIDFNNKKLSLILVIASSAKHTEEEEGKINKSINFLINEGTEKPFSAMPVSYLQTTWIELEI